MDIPEKVIVHKGRKNIDHPFDPFDGGLVHSKFSEDGTQVQRDEAEIPKGPRVVRVQHLGARLCHTLSLWVQDFSLLEFLHFPT